MKFVNISIENEAWLNDLKDDFLSVGKALLNEGKAALETMEIVNSITNLEFIKTETKNQIITTSSLRIA